MIALDDLGITPPRVATPTQPAPETTMSDDPMVVRPFWEGVSGPTATITRNLLDLGMGSRDLMLMLAFDAVGHWEGWGVNQLLRFADDLDNSLWSDEEFEALNRGPRSNSPLLGVGLGGSGRYFKCDRITRLDFVTAQTPLRVRFDGHDSPGSPPCDFISQRDIWRTCSPGGPVGGRWAWNSAHRWFFSRREADAWLDATLCNHY